MNTDVAVAASSRSTGWASCSQAAGIAVDSAGVVTAWSSEARDLLGYESAEAVGRTATELMASPALQTASCCWTGGEAWKGTFVLRCRDGSRLPMQVEALPTLDHTGAALWLMRLTRLARFAETTPSPSLGAAATAGQGRTDRQLSTLNEVGTRTVSASDPVHTADEGARVATWDLPVDPASASHARELVRNTLAAWSLEEVACSAELVISELVTNAVRYGYPPVQLRLVGSTSLICEVTDASDTAPYLPNVRDSDEGGRGLLIVDQLTTSWGSRRTEFGKTIWAELPLPSSGFGNELP